MESGLQLTKLGRTLSQIKRLNDGVVALSQTESAEAESAVRFDAKDTQETVSAAVRKLRPVCGG